MIYLILQIIFSSAFTLIIKWAQMRGREDVIAIGAVNYIVAALAILPFVFQIDFSATSSDSQLEIKLLGSNRQNLPRLKLNPDQQTKRIR